MILLGLRESSNFSVEEVKDKEKLEGLATLKNAEMAKIRHPEVELTSNITVTDRLNLTDCI